MSAQKTKHLRKKGASSTSSPKVSKPEAPEPVPHPIQHELKTLLNETPRQSIDVDWENLAPAGREFQ
ncbi:hypothetical protein ACIOYV_11790 [Pseudomonas sp. NPDC087342]|uniref:hypothetical protein n=1 Tax=Pseudomonas sp. NPDC087342 TaxID=3364437 RepID=UPI003811DB20